MKLIYPSCLTIVSASYMALTSLHAIEPYPSYGGVRVSVAESEIRKAITLSWEVFRNTYGEVPPPTVALTTHLSVLGSKIPKRQWNTIAPQGRMPLPNVLILPYSWSESSKNLGYLTPDTSIVPILADYESSLSVLLSSDPTAAFALIAERGEQTQVGTIDLLHVKATRVGYWPGQPLEKSIDRAVWEKLHESVNPCCRLVALQQFESTSQSPGQMLSVYRECLLGACSYLELVVLESIQRRQDFRPEVISLLNEYLSLNPLDDDGTLRYARSNFSNLKEGAKALIAAGVENKNLKEPESSPANHNSALDTSHIGIANTVSEPTKENDKYNNGLPWYAWMATIIAITGLLWLLLRKRKQ